MRKSQISNQYGGGKNNKIVTGNLEKEYFKNKNELFFDIKNFKITGTNRKNLPLQINSREEFDNFFSNQVLRQIQNLKTQKMVHQLFGVENLMVNIVQKQKQNINCNFQNSGNFKQNKNNKLQVQQSQQQQQQEIFITSEKQNGHNNFNGGQEENFIHNRGNLDIQDIKRMEKQLINCFYYVICTKFPQVIQGGAEEQREITNFFKDKMKKNYSKIFTIIPSPKDEVINYQMFILGYMVHYLFYKYFIEQRELFDMRFNFDVYLMLIFEFNGVLVSDHFVKIQIENLFTNKFLEYERIRILYVQRQAKQAMQKPTDFFGFKLNQTSPDKLDFKGKIFARKLQEKFSKNQYQSQNYNQGVKIQFQQQNQQNEGKSGRQLSSLQSNKKNNLVDFELADEEDNKELYDKQMVLINFNNFLDKNKKEQEIQEKKIEEQEEKIKIFRKSQLIEDANFLKQLEGFGKSQWIQNNFKSNIQQVSPSINSILNYENRSLPYLKKKMVYHSTEPLGLKENKLLKKMDKWSQQEIIAMKNMGKKQEILQQDILETFGIEKNKNQQKNKKRPEQVQHFFKELEELSLVLEKYQYGMEDLQGSKKMWENLKNVEFPYVQGLREKEKWQKLSVVKNIYDSKKFQILALIREYEKKKKKALKFEMKGRVQYFNPQNDYKNSTDEYDILVKQIEEATNDLQIFKEKNKEIFSELKKSNLGQIGAQKQNFSDEQKTQKSEQLDTSFEEVVGKFEKVIKNTKKKQNKYKIIIENELLQQTGKKLIQQNQTFNLNMNYNQQNQTQSTQQINRKQINQQQSQDFKPSYQQQSQQKQQFQKKNEEFEYCHENIKFEVYDGQGQLQNTQEQLQKQQEQQKLMNFNRNSKDTKLYKDNRRQYKNEHKEVIQSLVDVKQLTKKPQLEVIKHRNYDKYITEKVKDEFKLKKLQKIEHEKKLKEIEEKEQFQKLQELQKKQDKLAQQQQQQSSQQFQGQDQVQKKNSHQFCQQQSYNQSQNQNQQIQNQQSINQNQSQNQNENEQEQNRLNQQLAIDLELYKQRQLAEQMKLEQQKEEEKLRQLREKGEKYRQFAEQTINKFEEIGQIQGEVVKRLQKIK